MKAGTKNSFIYHFKQNREPTFTILLVVLHFKSEQCVLSKCYNIFCMCGIRENMTIASKKNDYFVVFLVFKI